MKCFCLEEEEEPCRMGLAQPFSSCGTLSNFISLAFSFLICKIGLSFPSTRVLPSLGPAL